MGVCNLTIGSLFNGISGWILAGQKYGVETLWESEVDKFCEAVTKHHFPDVVQLGDITKLDGAKLWPVDIICAGSPCQDLSVAGKQEGLKGERSGLFRDAIRLIRDMRRASGGRYPRFFVWENVPGAFSSNKGADFRAVLEEIGQTSIPMPEGGKWANAGLAELPECEIAWRVLDAQHHVPQRRKRIFIVADFAAERRCAGEILLVSESVSRDIETGGESREGFTGGTESGAHGASGSLTPWDVQSKQIYREDGIAPCLSGADGSGRQPIVAAGFKAGQSMAGSVGNGQLDQARLSDKVGALNCMHDQQEVMYTAGSFAGYQATEQSGSLKASGGDIGGGSESIVCQKTVRRLTPTECERLQGLPDGYTLIDDKTCSDTARYKALGNGMAMPCADYVIKRIVEVTA